MIYSTDYKITEGIVIWVYRARHVSDVTSPVLDRHWPVVQMQRSFVHLELFHRHRVEKSARMVLPTNIESKTIHYDTRNTRQHIPLCLVDHCEHHPTF